MTDTLQNWATSYVRNCKPANNGARNDTAFNVAGHLRAARGEQGEELSKPDITSAMRDYCSRLPEPLPDNEILSVVESVFAGNGTPRPTKIIKAAGRKGQVKRAGVGIPLPANSPAIAQTQNDSEPLASITSARDLIVFHPELRESVIRGLLRTGETMNIIAPSKAGKSWMVYDIIMSLVCGQLLFGTFQIDRPCKVLLIDNELHPETSANRLPKVAQQRGLQLDHWVDKVDVLNLRGKLVNINGLRQYFDPIKHGEYGAVFLDAAYRLQPADGDENSNGGMAMFYNTIDKYAAQLGCCFILVHHTSKGTQSEKAVTDVGAGAGAQSRAADTHLVLRAHEEDHCVVLDAAVRSFAPIEPICLRWSYPVWNRAPDLDPTLLKRAPGRRKRSEDAKADEPKREKYTPERFAACFITDEPMDKKIVMQKARVAGITVRDIEAYISICLKAQLIHQWTFKGDRRVLLCNYQQEVFDIDSHTHTPPTPPGSNQSCSGAGDARECDDEFEGIPE